MDKNAIKKYAVWARNELIARVAQKAEQYEITEKKTTPADADNISGKVLTATEKKQRQALIAKINTDGFGQVVEEVAYTWFNRFTALRFMEVNNYLPSHTRIFTNEAGEFKPQILTDAIQIDLDDLDLDRVYELKDANKTEELYKYLLITQCNALSKVLPRMFQRIEDYTELLLPDYLLREGSVIEQMIVSIPEEDWTNQIEIIGWLYQYYNTELKAKADLDVKSGLKIDKNNLPEKTQVFTPDWIVRYMVENSLGRLWIEGHPGGGLREKWNYYLDETAQEEDAKAQMNELRKEYEALKPEELRVIDPCMGSGHILCVLFDSLIAIYEDYGYTAREAASLIVDANLWGLDVDERAAQLSYFTVMMKARQYDRRFFSRNLQPHIYAVHESNNIAEIYNQAISDLPLQQKHKETIDYLIRAFLDAKEYGSILKLDEYDYRGLKEAWDLCLSDDSGKHTINLWSLSVIPEITYLIEQAIALTQKYHVVVTNPPYLGLRSIGNKTLEYIQTNYPDSKNDFFAVFIERAFSMTLPIGQVGLVTAESWLSLSSFEKLRINVLTGTTITTMAHLGEGAFDAGFGTVAFSALKKYIHNYIGTYYKLNDNEDGDWKRLILQEKKKEYCYHSKQQDFGYVPGMAVSYWVSSKMFDTFTKYASMNDIAEPRQGLTTCDNNRFMRFWHEVVFNNIGLGFTSTEETISAPQKWFPYNKGGEPRKWYGNNDYVVNWQHDGEEVKAFVASKYVSYTRTVKNIPYYFRKGLTWSAIAKKYAVRAYDEGFIFADKGQACFVDDSRYYYICGLLNSKYCDAILAIISPTLDFNCGYIKKIPVALDEEHKEVIESLVKENIALSKEDWDSFESSWDFKEHPLITAAKYYFQNGEKNITINQAFTKWETLAESRFTRLKANEERLNRIFIDIYGLGDELNEKVEDNDVTVRKADFQRDVRSLISYSVGCMFGRYSLDKPGLMYAGGKWEENQYSVFKPDGDGIIPICDDEYFEDDIVGRFIGFIDKAFGAQYLEENLKEIADALGGKGSAREIIRNYFINDFYNDHLKVYQKRPIYWLFDSGKKNGFKCLIYVHRYQPDTIARIRTDYVHEQQSRYRTAIADLENRINSAGTSERVKLNKQLSSLQAQATEIREYEEKIHHLADQMISIDLDDGVKHNYEIFKDVLAKIK